MKKVEQTEQELTEEDFERIFKLAPDLIDIFFPSEKTADAIKALEDRYEHVKIFLNWQEAARFILDRMEVLEEF